jgi:DNA processing protein
MNETDELRAWLTALRTPGLGPGGLREALAAAGGRIDAALARLRRQAAALGEGAAAWLDAPDAARLAEDLAWLGAPGHRLLRCTDADFPPLLDTIPQPPAVLFVAGDAGLLLRPQVAIVGARAASPAGLEHARRFARALAQAGFVVASGMADGVDGAAHEAALEAACPPSPWSAPGRIGSTRASTTCWPGASRRKAPWSASFRPAPPRAPTIFRAGTG